eukprot:scaffold1263_cov302-Pinguiococcus_pyrenoidosus.AAC.1
MPPRPERQHHCQRRRAGWRGSPKGSQRRFEPDGFSSPPASPIPRQQVARAGGWPRPVLAPLEAPPLQQSP